jgi:hypothetical protein
MKHVWSVLCQKSIIDQHSNNISLIEVLEQLNINISPTQIAQAGGKGIVLPIRFDVVSLWAKSVEGEKSDFEVEAELYDPANKKLQALFQRMVAFPQHYQRMRTQVTIGGFTVTQPGIYVIKVKMRHEDKVRAVAELPLEIKFVFSAQKKG